MQLLIIWSAIVGVILASFVNVLIYRLPRNISLFSPAFSFCPNCKTRIPWYYNIPIVTWLILGGHCHFCKKPIGLLYFVVEILGATGAVMCFVIYGINFTALTAFLLFINLIAIAIIDWQYKIIPHTLTISGIVIGIALSPYNNRGIESAVLGMLVGGCSLLFLTYIYKAFKGYHGIGGGDIMLLAMIGTYFGPFGSLVILFVASFISILFVLLVYRWRVEGDYKISFGSFLSITTVLMLLQ